MTDVSFIIPAYNSHLTIGKTIQSIVEQKLQEKIADIIIVDSSDDHKTREIFRRFDHSKLKIITLNQKTSPSQGRNIGAKIAAGKLLCFIDSDVFLSGDWLSNIWEAVKNGCRSGCGSVSTPDFQQTNALALAQLYLQFNESLAVGQTRQVVMVPACNMFVDRSLFEKAGGFPDLRASEDVMLCLKLGEIDKVWFVPSAKCYHIFREDIQAYFKNQIVLGRYIIIYRRMVYDKWYYKGLWPVFMLPFFLVIKSARIKWRIYKAGWGHFRKFLGSSHLFAMGLFFWAAGFLKGCMQKENSNV